MMARNYFLVLEARGEAKTGVAGVAEAEFIVESLLLFFFFLVQGT